MADFLCRCRFTYRYRQLFRRRSRAYEFDQYQFLAVVEPDCATVDAYSQVFELLTTIGHYPMKLQP